MPYMVVLLDLLRLPKMFLCNLLPWILLHLISQVNLQFSMNFLNCMRIVRTLVPLLLLHIQVHLLLALLTPILLVLGFSTQVSLIILPVINLFSLFFFYLRLFTNHYHGANRISSHGFGTIHLLPSLSIDNVLYVPRSPFNLLSISRLIHSIDCVISFYQRFYLLTRSEFGTDDWHRM